MKRQEPGKLPPRETRKWIQEEFHHELQPEQQPEPEQ